MKITDKQICFGLIVGTRGFFNPQLAQAGRAQLLAQLEALGMGFGLDEGQQEENTGGRRDLTTARKTRDAHHHL